jgi:hypothetical protein
MLTPRPYAAAFVVASLLPRQVHPGAGCGRRVSWKKKGSDLTSFLPSRDGRMASGGHLGDTG